MVWTTTLCIKHGGDIPMSDCMFCSVCNTEGISRCDCGGIARFFGEALMSSITCERCNTFLMGIDIKNLKERWNNGERGTI